MARVRCWFAFVVCLSCGAPFSGVGDLGSNSGAAGAAGAGAGGSSSGAAGAAGAGAGGSSSGAAGAAGAGAGGSSSGAAGAAGAGAGGSSSGAAGAAGAGAGGSSSGAAGVAGDAGANACLHGWQGSTCDTCTASPPPATGRTCSAILACYEAQGCGPASCMPSCEYAPPGASDQVVAVARAVFLCRCP
jgi:hypothetical protein